MKIKYIIAEIGANNHAVEVPLDPLLLPLLLLLLLLLLLISSQWLVILMLTFYLPWFSLCFMFCIFFFFFCLYHRNLHMPEDSYKSWHSVSGAPKFKGCPSVYCVGGQFMAEFETGREYIPTTNIKLWRFSICDMCTRTLPLSASWVWTFCNSHVPWEEAWFWAG
jgi:hypothetical protein